MIAPVSGVLPETPPAAEPMLDPVLFKKNGAIAYVTVNRPKVLNALNTPTWRDLRTAFEDARDDDAVRGVILTGAGNKAFIAGADISELGKATALDAERASRFGQQVLDLIENLGKPVIAAVNGFALGGGCETAMACTIRIAVDTAKYWLGIFQSNFTPAAASASDSLKPGILRKRFSTRFTFSRPPDSPRYCWTRAALHKEATSALTTIKTAWDKLQTNRVVASMRVDASTTT